MMYAWERKAVHVGDHECSYCYRNRRLMQVDATSPVITLAQFIRTHNMVLVAVYVVFHNADILLGGPCNLVGCAERVSKPEPSRH